MIRRLARLLGFERVAVFGLDSDGFGSDDSGMRNPVSVWWTGIWQRRPTGTPAVDGYSALYVGSTEYRLDVPMTQAEVEAFSRSAATVGMVGAHRLAEAEQSARRLP